MNAKITKQRLSHLLSYDWLKIIATIVGIILFWELIFTMSATRILSSQQFGIYNYIGSSITQRFNEYANSADSFSHELIQISVEDLTAGGNEYVYTLAESRLATNEADVVFAPDIEGNNLVQYKKEINGELINATCLEDFLYRYSQYVYQLDGEKGYFKQMENYLNGYYNGDYKNGELDEEKVETDFRTFVSATKDKRYKTAEQISSGIEGEIKRIKGYKTALIEFNSYLEKGYISLTEKTLYRFSNNEIFELTGAYSINLCPNEKMENLKKDVYYRITDEESSQTKTTALNMNLILIRDDKAREGLVFESLAFVNQIIRTHCADLNQN